MPAFIALSYSNGMKGGLLALLYSLDASPVCRVAGQAALFPASRAREIFGGNFFGGNFFLAGNVFLWEILHILIPIKATTRRQ
jgi:hypothetical protein